MPAKAVIVAVDIAVYFVVVCKAHADVEAQRAIAMRPVAALRFGNAVVNQFQHRLFRKPLAVLRSFLSQRDLERNVSVSRNKVDFETIKRSRGHFLDAMRECSARAAPLVASRLVRIAFSVPQVVPNANLPLVTKFFDDLWAKFADRLVRRIDADRCRAIDVNDVFCSLKQFSGLRARQLCGALARDLWRRKFFHAWRYAPSASYKRDVY